MRCCSFDSALARLKSSWLSDLAVSFAQGGNVNDGGNNYPLRGNKATTWEGGVRGLGFISGAGISAKVAGTVSHEIIHVTDWCAATLSNPL